MTATIIDGNIIAQQLLEEVRQDLSVLLASGRPRPKLVAILVGNDPPSHIYVKRKKQICESVGIETEVAFLDEQTDDKILHQVIEGFNKDSAITGILLQLPLPKHLNTKLAISKIAIEKDVDGLTPHHQGCLQWRFPSIYPCTAIAVVHVIKQIFPKIVGKTAAIIGLSPLAGGSISSLLSQDKATTINIHRFTSAPEKLTKQADIIVSCTGVKGLITKDWIKEGALIVDVGIYREGQRIFGDVDFNAAKNIAGWITPVPGGVGPVTIAMLAKNTLSLLR